jgi:DNA-binding ferritin-like protein
VSFDVTLALEKKILGLSVDLGSEKPAAVRQRPMKELEQANQQAEKANAAVKIEAQQLEEAKSSAKLLDERRSDLEQQLKQISSTAADHGDAPTVVMSDQAQRKD